MTLSYPPPSRHSLEADLATARQNGDFAAEAECLMALGHIAKENEEYDLAQGLYGQAWAAYEKAGDIQNQAHSLKRLGDLFSKLWETQDIEEMHVSASTIYNHALTLYRAINDLQGEAWTLKAKGDLEVDRDLPTQERSVTNYRAALSLFKNIEDPVGEAHTLVALSGMLHWLRRDISDLLQRALILTETLEDDSGQAQIFELLANNAKEEKNFTQARVYLERAITFYNHLKQTEKEADLWILLGEYSLNDEDREAAIAYLDKALTLSISIKNTPGVQRALYTLHKSMRVYRDEISIWREVGNPIQEVYALQMAGAKAQREKNFSLARDLFKQALVLDSQLYDVRSERASLLSALGEVAQEEGNFAADNGGWEGRQDNAEFIEKLAHFLLRVNAVDLAIICFHKACNLWQQTRELSRKGSILETIADAERMRKNYDKAHIALEEALAIFSVWHYEMLRPGVFWRLGLLEAEQNHDDEAHYYFQQAWKIGPKKGLLYQHIETLWYWGRFEWSRGNLQLGCKYCHQAITLAEQKHDYKQDRTLIQQNIPIKTWKKDLAAMNCPTPPDSETSHDL